MQNPDCIRVLFSLTVATLLGSCESYGPFHPNTATQPLNSIRGPSDGRYKFAFIEFGDQGSALDTSQRAAALNAIRQAQRPLLFVYIHGWMNNANSGDVILQEGGVYFIDFIASCFYLMLSSTHAGSAHRSGLAIGTRIIGF